MRYKENTFSPITQGVSEKTYVNFLKNAYDSVKMGVIKSSSDFVIDPEQFNFRTIKAIWINSTIKKLFQRSFLIDESFRNSVKHLKSHGVDYYVIEGKFIVCFKKMDIKSRVSGFYSRRFKNLMEGKAIHYSKKMLDNLALMGINKPLPIFFIGHVIDKIGNLIDVRMVHYNNSKLAYVISLEDYFKPNLFTQIESAPEVKVTSKNLQIKKDVI